MGERWMTVVGEVEQLKLSVLFNCFSSASSPTEKKPRMASLNFRVKRP